MELLLLILIPFVFVVIVGFVIGFLKHDRMEEVDMYRDVKTEDELLASKIMDFSAKIGAKLGDYREDRAFEKEYKRDLDEKYKRAVIEMNERQKREEKEGKENKVK